MGGVAYTSPTHAFNTEQSFTDRTGLQLIPLLMWMEFQGIATLTTNLITEL